MMVTIAFRPCDASIRARWRARVIGQTISLRWAFLVIISPGHFSSLGTEYRDRKASFDAARFSVPTPRLILSHYSTGTA